MTNKDVKKIICDNEEYIWNCQGRLCIYSVKVVNVRQRKRYYLADIIVNNPHDNESQRFNDCEYNKQIFDLI